MIYLNVWLKVKDEANVERVRALLHEAATLSKQEPGCERFEVYHSNNDTSCFLLHEHWQSQAALEVHRTGKAYTTVYQPHIMPLVDREGHPSQLI